MFALSMFVLSSFMGVTQEYAGAVKVYCGKEPPSSLSNGSMLVLRSLQLATNLGGRKSVCPGLPNVGSCREPAKFT